MTHDQKLKLIEQMFGHQETRRTTYRRTVGRSFVLMLMLGFIAGIPWTLAQTHLSAWKPVMYGFAAAATAIWGMPFAIAMVRDLRDHHPDWRARIRASIAGVSVPTPRT